MSPCTPPGNGSHATSDMLAALAPGGSGSSPTSLPPISWLAAGAAESATATSTMSPAIRECFTARPLRRWRHSVAERQGHAKRAGKGSARGRQVSAPARSLALDPHLEQDLSAVHDQRLA